ncbi:MAG: UDP-N-acetylmuramoyl-L-alanyl-D-glutamate--2,6-diaminopimelate ligase, partial [Xanthomonadaceae bacterium]|nr:UDP-N-acetylmuramoyl-L-alanyl-D-glutamate--2,6-diaminopimelate ligase [Xanthomonadaceae bacterium]
MRLDDMLRGIATPAHGDIMVSGLTQDSHAVRPGDAFVALAGAKHHGIEFAPQAVGRGASVVIAETRAADLNATLNGAPVVWID